MLSCPVYLKYKISLNSIPISQNDVTNVIPRNSSGDCLANNITRYTWQASITTRDPIGCGINPAFSQGIITLREFSVLKVRKPLVFACENSFLF